MKLNVSLAAKSLPSLALALLAFAGCEFDRMDSSDATDGGSFWTLEQSVHSVCAPPVVIEGMDVSVYQGNINWDAIKAPGRIKFAYIRNSHGLGTTDTQFARNWAEAKRVGIPRGAYQYFDASGNALAQAQRYMDLVDAQGGYEADDLPPMIDVESTGGASAATIVANVRTWIDYVEGQTNKRPIIYTGSYFWDSNVGSTAFSDYFLWTAHYTSGNCGLTSDAWEKWLIWQYTSSETLPGITVNTVDIDRFAGTEAELLNWAHCGELTGCGETSVQIATNWEPVSGQQADLVSVGSSAGIFDLIVGQRTEGRIVVRNGNQRPATDDMVIGYWLEEPFVDAFTYTIETDRPAFDGVSFVRSDQMDRSDNPPSGAPPNQGFLHLGSVVPGESIRVRFTVDAQLYSFGASDHPDLRAWVKHIADYYGEQDAWDDPVESNGAGTLLRAYSQLDIFEPDQWQFNGGDYDDVEGWSIGAGVSDLAINTVDDALAIKASSDDPQVLSPPWTHIDAATQSKLVIRHRQHGGPRTVQLFWAQDGEAFSESRSIQFDSIGDTNYERLELDLSQNPEWTGVVTSLRLDSWNGGPFTGAPAWYDVDYLELVSVETPIIDEDGDGATSDVDCDDQDGARYPSAEEVCDGIDNDCDEVVDEDNVCSPPDEEVAEELSEELLEDTWETTDDGMGLDALDSGEVDRQRVSPRGSCDCSLSGPRSDSATGLVLGLGLSLLFVLRRRRRGSLS